MFPAHTTVFCFLEQISSCKLSNQEPQYYIKDISVATDATWGWLWYKALIDSWWASFSAGANQQHSINYSRFLWHLRIWLSSFKAEFESFQIINGPWDSV